MRTIHYRIFGSRLSTCQARAAQSKVVRMMISGVGQNAGEMDPQKLVSELNGPLSDPDLLVT
jgi:hypothetical protein